LVGQPQRHVLAPAPGKATLNVLEMAREGLLIPLRAALQEARRSQQAVSRDGVRVESNGGHFDIVIEQQDAANEELQSANEEVQSANEELQNRNEELNRVNNDLNNLFGSVQLAIVMVWRDLRIRRFTPLAEKVFSLIASDIGRPISDIKLKIEAADLPEILLEVIDSVSVRELEVRDIHARKRARLESAHERAPGRAHPVFTAPKVLASQGDQRQIGSHHAASAARGARCRTRGCLPGHRPLQVGPASAQYGRARAQSSAADCFALFIQHARRIACFSYIICDREGA
jgi:hypothetical protein